MTTTPKKTARELIEAMTVQIGPNMTEAYSQAEKLLTPAELEQVVKFKERGFSIMVAVRLDMPIEGEDKVFRDAFTGAVSITVRDALYLTQRTTESVVEKGGRIRCYVTASTRTDLKTLAVYPIRTLWISQ